MERLPLKLMRLAVCRLDLVSLPYAVNAFRSKNVLRDVWDGPRPDLWPCLWCTRICVCSASMVLFRAGTQGHVTLLPPKRVVLSTCKHVSLFKRAAGRLVRVTGISHASVSKTLPRREGNRARDAVPSP